MVGPVPSEARRAESRGRAGWLDSGPESILNVRLVKLTNQLTMTRPRKPDRQRQSQPLRSASSRQRLLAAAAAEFAARGFAGASVERIARAARVNKAMLY